MDFDDLEKSWAKQSVTGSAVAAPEVAAALERELKSARRRFTGMVVMATGLLLLGWTMATIAHQTGIKRLTVLETAGHVTGSLFYLGWLVLAVRAKRAVQREASTLGDSTCDSAAASLRVVDLQIATYRIAAWSLPLAVGAAMSFSLAKFYRGELHGLGAGVTIVFAVSLAGIAGAAMWRRYRTELKPRRQELQRILSELDRGGAA